MKNGKFAPEEREHPMSLDAVDEVRAKPIVYSKQFKKECMRRYRAGERPGDIFAGAGPPSSLIGYKRIERAICHWKEAGGGRRPDGSRRPAGAPSQPSRYN